MENSNSGDKTSLPVHSERILGSIDKDSLKSLFYLYTAKPDARTKLFQRPVVVTPADVLALNRKIREKLIIHGVGNVVSTAMVQFEDKEAVEFGVWSEFESFDWNTAEITSEVVLKWEFMLDLAHLKLPQKHTLSVRICSPMTPKQFFQMLMSGDAGELDNVDGDRAFCVCRVDFVNHILASELIELVAKWNEALPQEQASCAWFSKLERIDGLLISWVQLLISCSIAIIFIGVLKNVTHKYEGSVIGVEVIRTICFWAIGLWLTLEAGSKIGRLLGRKVYDAVNNYGPASWLSFTKGDENKAHRRVVENGSNIRQFLWINVVAFLINVLAGVFTWWILPATN